MPTREQIVEAGLLARLDALDAAAVALGAPDAVTLLQWLNGAGIRYGQTNFADPNASGLAQVFSTWNRRTNRLVY